MSNFNDLQTQFLNHVIVNGNDGVFNIDHISKGIIHMGFIEGDNAFKGAESGIESMISDLLQEEAIHLFHPVSIHGNVYQVNRYLREKIAAKIKKIKKAIEIPNWHGIGEHFKKTGNSWIVRRHSFHSDKFDSNLILNEYTCCHDDHYWCGPVPSFDRNKYHSDFGTFVNKERAISRAYFRAKDTHREYFWHYLYFFRPIIREVISPGKHQFFATYRESYPNKRDAIAWKRNRITCYEAIDLSNCFDSSEDNLTLSFPYEGMLKFAPENFRDYISRCWEHNINLKAIKTEEKAKNTLDILEKKLKKLKKTNG